MWETYGDYGPITNTRLPFISYKMDSRVDARFKSGRVRIFLPPGLQTHSVSIQHIRPPNWRPIILCGLGAPSASSVPDATSVDLFHFQGGKRFIAFQGEGRDVIVSRASERKTFNVSDATWFYMRFISSELVNVNVSMLVDATIYNNWYNSIDWWKDVEGKPAPAPAPVPPGPTPPPEPEPEPEPEPTPSPGPDKTTVTRIPNGYKVELVDFRLIEGMRIRNREYYAIELNNNGTWKRI